MIVLIAPSKTMDFTQPAPSFVPVSDVLFQPEANQLVAKAIKTPHFNKVFGISDKLGTKTKHELKQWGSGPKKQAFWAYRGDVYDGLDIDSFTAEQIKGLTAQVRVVSGLYGYLRPTDMIERYRLEMKTKLSGRGYRDLYDFWESKIAEQILVEKPDILINCTSEEYMKAIRPYLPSDIKIVTPKFIQIYDDKRGEREATIFTKRARGAFAAFIAKSKPKTVQDLQKFAWAEYTYDKETSTIELPVFKRYYKQSLKSS